MTNRQRNPASDDPCIKTLKATMSTVVHGRMDGIIKNVFMSPRGGMNECCVIWKLR